MTNKMLMSASADSPSPGERWLHLSEKDRLAAVSDCLLAGEQNFADTLDPVSARNDGQVTFKLKHELSVSVRGGFLLDAEQWLKNELDESITVWLEPTGDRSSLRRLRGVEVKV